MNAIDDGRAWVAQTYPRDVRRAILAALPPASPLTHRRLLEEAFVVAWGIRGAFTIQSTYTPARRRKLVNELVQLNRHLGRAKALILEGDAVLIDALRRPTLAPPPTGFEDDVRQATEGRDRDPSDIASQRPRLMLAERGMPRRPNWNTAVLSLLALANWTAEALADAAAEAEVDGTKPVPTDAAIAYRYSTVVDSG